MFYADILQKESSPKGGKNGMEFHTSLLNCHLGRKAEGVPSVLLSLCFVKDCHFPPEPTVWVDQVLLLPLAISLCRPIL